MAKMRKIYKLTTVTVVTISVFLLFAYTSIYLKSNTDLLYQQYSMEQAIKDAEMAIKQKDIFVYVTGTIACSPAVERKYTNLAESLPWKPLACGCVIDDYKLRRVQERYARTFNRMIMQHVKITYIENESINTSAFCCLP
jgi:hypothetical protein